MCLEVSCLRELYLFKKFSDILLTTIFYYEFAIRAIPAIRAAICAVIVRTGEAINKPRPKAKKKTIIANLEIINVKLN